MTTVFTGIISRSKPEWATSTSLQQACMHAHANNIKVLLMTHVGDSLLCRGRQEVLYQFKQSKADYLFTVDDDIELPLDTIIKLVNANKDYIGGLYRLKGNEHGKTAVRKLHEVRPGLKNYRTKEVLAYKNKIDKDQIEEVKYISGGCTLLTRETMEAMWDAYNDSVHKYYNDGDGFTERRALYMPFVHEEEYLSEDWAFCQRLLNTGKKIYAHMGVLCGHIGKYTWRIEDK